MELEGRVAVVTGGGTGIGRAIAAELARAGAELVLVGRRAEPLEAARADLDAAGHTVRALPADLRSDDWLAALERAAPRVDVLVHNAAAFATYAPLERVPPDELARVVDTILAAALRLSAHALPGMKARGFGRVLHIGSVAATLGADGQAAYAAAKAALHGLTRSLALEGARHGVTCNLLELGYVATERTAAAIPPELRAALVESTPLGRAGTAEEVAYVARCLASPRAGFVTGACVPVAGGLGLGLFPLRDPYAPPHAAD